LRLVANLIEPGSRVLDLGCGEGELLDELIRHKDCQGTGMEVDPGEVLKAISKGIAVVEGNVDADLDVFDSNSFDVVVLSRTMQVLQSPEAVLRQMVRIAPKLVVSVPNFGWWGNRLRLARGRMPMSKDLPFDWFNSPNIRFTTLVDLQLLFDAVGLVIEQRTTLAPSGRPLKHRDRLANLLAGAAIYSLRGA
jgi:methionine biosynthesis protein MetW